MRTIDFTRPLVSTKLVWKESWRKDYGNGTMLVEFQGFKSTRSKKHIARLQIGYYIESGEVIGATLSINGTDIQGQDFYSVNEFMELIEKYA